MLATPVEKRPWPAGAPEAPFSARSCLQAAPSLGQPSANQPLGLRWPALSALFSTQMLSLVAPPSLSFNGLVSRSAVAQRSGAMTMGVESLVGASEEISGKVWDPLKLSQNMDEGNLNLVRAAELKHCRVAMLATVGWVWTATGAHFEGMLSTSAGISFASLAALDPLTAASKVPPAGIWQMIVAIGTLEVTASRPVQPTPRRKQTHPPRVHPGWRYLPDPVERLQPPTRYAPYEP